jgi:tetratricopeptide (TPR) repeat protein
LKQFININIFAMILIVGCTPPSGGASPDAGPSMTSEELAERNMECDLYISFAMTNYQNRDYESTVENYNHILGLGCGQRNAEDIYQWMGRSFIELSKLDSANYVFKQGLKYLKDDDNLYEVAAWNAGKLGNVEEKIYFLDQWLGLDESNEKVLELLSNVYRDQGMYEDQITILNQWLKVDSSNKTANAEKKAAYSILGKDEVDVDRERWEADPSNVKYGIDYVKGLLEAGLDEKAVVVCQSLLVYDKFNTKVLRLLGDANLNQYKDDLALEAYENLANIDPNNYNVAMEISKIYSNKEDAKSALKWAENALKSSGNSGEAMYQRAEVFYALVETCTGDALSFWDKVVYEIAWQDYNSAVKSGYYRAKTRRNFLEENNITNTSDWFMRPDNERQVSPQGDCYSWIKRKITRK